MASWRAVNGPINRSRRSTSAGIRTGVLMSILLGECGVRDDGREDREAAGVVAAPPTASPPVSADAERPVRAGRAVPWSLEWVAGTGRHAAAGHGRPGPARRAGR